MKILAARDFFYSNFCPCRSTYATTFRDSKYAREREFLEAVWNFWLLHRLDSFCLFNCHLCCAYVFLLHVAVTEYACKEWVFIRVLLGVLFLSYALYPDVNGCWSILSSLMVCLQWLQGSGYNLSAVYSKPKMIFCLWIHFSVLSKPWFPLKKWQGKRLHCIFFIHHPLIDC